VNFLNVVEYGDGVFKGVKMPTCIINFEKSKPKATFSFRRIYKGTIQDKELKQNISLGIPNIPIDPNLSIITPILNKSIPIGAKFKITRGLEFGKNKLKEMRENENDLPIVSGDEIRRYRYDKPKHIDLEIFKRYKKDSSIFSPPKVMIREAGGGMMASYDEYGILTLRTVFNFKNKDKSIHPKYLTCLLNSKLYSFLFNTMFKPTTEIFPKIRISQARVMPLYPAETKKQEIFVEKAENMLRLHKDLADAKTPNEKQMIQRQIDATDNQIDNLVYELYGITDQEIKIVEESLK